MSDSNETDQRLPQKGLRSPVVDAWIDVGGTFTDCFIRVPGAGPSSTASVRRGKTLSSGRVPFSVTQITPAAQLFAPELCEDVPHFWNGTSVSLSHARREDEQRDGEQREDEHWATVVGFKEGWLTLDFASPEVASLVSRDPAVYRFQMVPNMAAPVLVTRRLLGIPIASPLPPLRVRIGTTKGTNALLTRQGARSALAITAHLADLPYIGDQTRSDLFALDIPSREPLTSCILPIEERLDAKGEILRPLDRERTFQQLRQAFQSGYESLAICLMHSYSNPEHEQAVEQLARRAGFRHVSRSSDLAPLIEIVARMETTSVDAYLSPIVRDYLGELVSQFGGDDVVQMLVMTSAGGLVDWREYRGKDSILSGPAGGVAALAALRDSLENDQLIGLDMGGTSTDVCRVAREHTLQYESNKAGVRILTPTLPIETVAAGGGSVCWFDGVSLRVGPQSAGADPGPACYGRGGPLTVTDLNVVLGRIPESQFPFRLDLGAARSRLMSLCEQAGDQLGVTSCEQLALGLRRLACEQMAGAVRTVSLTQGTDPRSHALVGFGGAAGQHVCQIAEVLGVHQVFDHADAGLLSALGMGLAETRLDDVAPVYELVKECNLDELERTCTALTAPMRQQLIQRGAQADDVRIVRWLELRYLGSDSSLTVPWNRGASIAEWIDLFRATHVRRYGYDRSQTEIELVSIRLECVASPIYHLPTQENTALSEGSADMHHAGAVKSDERATIVFDDQQRLVPVVQREKMVPGQTLAGPAIVLNRGSTFIIEPGWLARCLSNDCLMAEFSSEGALNELPRVVEKSASGEMPKNSSRPAIGKSSRHAIANKSFDPVFRECMARRLSAIASQMGVVLQQTAISVNVKQRRDYSCAVFDAHGHLLANAPHVPVHLGAMGQTVRSLLEEFPDMRPGDSFITNDPYRGGSHLPDVTLVHPVFDSDAPLSPVMFVANRAHHADIGGKAPGSMSITATSLGEEGAVITPRRLTAGGTSLLEELKRDLLSARYPPRNIGENLADITAQQAANLRGIELLQEYAAAEQWSRLSQYSEHLLAAAAERVQQYLNVKLSTEPNLLDVRFEDQLDDGTPICVTLSQRDDGRLRLDFDGSGPVSRNNFNANPSIVSAAVMYVIRCLMADDMPLNEGVMRAIDLVIPPGVLNPAPGDVPEHSPAVAAGNVETSQRIVDVLLGAFQAAAASQGTMNNLLFGNERFGFYETICGGAGATKRAPGADAVHTHMTNTRLTDPEVLESRYPVRLQRFQLRTGSGGAGQYRGGDGVIRQIKFLQPAEVSLLTSRRGDCVPFGLQGGSAGDAGRNLLIKCCGTTRQLSGCCQLRVSTGDSIEIQTPGGGGFGKEVI